jgi:hypothetical protein
MFRSTDDFWAWIDAGYPQRWAFWRLRDELDGLFFGVAAGLLIVAVACAAVAVL